MPLHIVHLTKFLSYQGGIEQATLGMAKAGKKLGHKVTLVGVRREGRDFSEFSKLNNTKNLISLPSILSFQYITSLNWSLKKADIIHLHFPNPMLEVAVLVHRWFWPLLSRGKIIPYFHAFVTSAPLGYNLLQQRRFQKIAQLAKYYLISHDCLLKKIKEMKMPVQKALMLPYMVEEPNFYFEPDPVWDKKQGTRLLYIGRLVPYKGLDILLRALYRIRNVSWYLVIAGEGKQKKVLMLLTKKLGLERRISFLGFVSENRKRRLLSSCDIFVYPSQKEQEAFGISVAEAFSYKKPVITSRLDTALSFLARGGRCGGQANVGDVYDLASKLYQLITDKERQRRCGEENFLFWKKQLSPPVYMRRYRGILSKWSR